MIDHGHYGTHILMSEGTHRPVIDKAEYADAWTEQRRRIGRDLVGDVDVSTVFLNIEHHGGMWFETMIFGGSYDEYCWRYATKAEAIAGHAAIVQALRDGTDPDAAVAS